MSWAQLRAGRVTGQGQLVPRLAFEVEARTPRDRMEVQLLLLHARLRAGGEHAGEGFLAGALLGALETHLRIEIPVGRAAVDHLTETLTGDRINLALDLSGILRGRDNNTDERRFASQPAPGEWVYQAFGHARQTELSFQIARSDWYAAVLRPIGTTEYFSTEIALPLGDHALRASVRRLQEADRAYGEGDSATVFGRCRAATEALPGAPKNIFDSLSDADEARALDALVQAANTYFHRGRHVDEAGEFPVDHADARFALGLVKLLIAQTARVLERAPK